MRERRGYHVIAHRETSQAMRVRCRDKSERKEIRERRYYGRTTEIRQTRLLRCFRFFFFSSQPMRVKIYVPFFCFLKHRKCARGKRLLSPVAGASQAMRVKFFFQKETLTIAFTRGARNWTAMLVHIMNVRIIFADS